MRHKDIWNTHDVIAALSRMTDSVQFDWYVDTRYIFTSKTYTVSNVFKVRQMAAN